MLFRDPKVKPDMKCKRWQEKGARSHGWAPGGTGGSGGRWGGAEPCLHGDRVQQMENTDMAKNSNSGVKNSSWGNKCAVTSETLLGTFPF